ncbi:MAG: polyprenol monophosphomannose synthase [Thermoprotei archaeon]|nr:MAG: polyprenol monophosphomannose synthase [Thermoprotei archaeon]
MLQCYRGLDVNDDAFSVLFRLILSSAWVWFRLVTSVSVIIPTYCEFRGLKRVLRDLCTVLSRCGIDYEVIVDDSSPDRTADVAKLFSKYYPVRVVVRPGRFGLYSAIIDGLKWASGEYVVVMDSDGQHPPALVPKMFLLATRCGYWLVIASRFVPGGSARGMGPIRRLISRFATFTAWLLVPRFRAVRDLQSGFFLARRDLLEKLRRYYGYSWKILLDVLSLTPTGKVCEVPFSFGLRLSGFSKFSLRVVIKYLIHVLILSTRIGLLSKSPLRHYVRRVLLILVQRCRGG